MGKAIVFGSMNMDLTIECERIPREGETIGGHGFLANAGGKGANQAVAAARLGAETQMVAAVGDDLFGRELLATLAGSGVGCSEVRQVEDAPTGTAIILRTRGDNRIVLGPGANHALCAGDVSESLDRIAEKGDVFVTQLECDLPTTFDALRLAHVKGLRCVLNPAPAHEVPDDVLACCDLVCVNETECESLTGVLPADSRVALAAARSLCLRGVGSVVVTLGARGSVATNGENDVVVSALPVDAVDSTGAGDTFIGSLVASMVAGRPLDEAMERATVASALAVTKVGAQQSIPSAAEVEEFMRRNHA